MREFWIYTLLRLAMLVGAFGITFGIWAALSDEVPLFWVVLIAFVISGIASFFVLNGPREAFAQRVQVRADRAASKFEEMRSAEDTD